MTAWTYSTVGSMHTLEVVLPARRMASQNAPQAYVRVTGMVAEEVDVATAWLWHERPSDEVH